MKPRLLDLFCGAGGCTQGYQRAGFHVTGVDINPQPNYCGDEFVQADALTFPLEGFDAIHASPPCQAYTSIRRFGKGAGEDAPDLVGDVRRRLARSGAPYVIENVVGAPLVNPIRLCGSAFGLSVWRHRLFEVSPAVVWSTPCAHQLAPEPIAVYGDHPQDSALRGTYHVRRARTLREGQRAMDIDWMPWKALTQAIPPAYTEFIGHQLMQALRHREAA